MLSLLLGLALADDATHLDALAVLTAPRPYDLLERFTHTPGCVARAGAPETCETLPPLCDLDDLALTDALPGWFDTRTPLGPFLRACDTPCSACCPFDNTCIACVADDPTRVGLGLGDMCECAHIGVCLETTEELRADLDAGVPHPLMDPGAEDLRRRALAEALHQSFGDWLDGLDTAQTSLAEVDDLLTARGCRDWHDRLAASMPTPTEIRSGNGTPEPQASQLWTTRSLGALRLLAAVPDLTDRLLAVESTVWPEDASATWLSGTDEDALLSFMPPLALSLLRASPSLQNADLLAVGEAAEGAWLGCTLGTPAEVSVHSGVDGAQLTLEVDPPAWFTVVWGDGHISQHSGPATHRYAEGGDQAIVVLHHDLSGLRTLTGFVAQVPEGTGEPTPPVLHSASLGELTVHTQALAGTPGLLHLELLGADDEGESGLGIGAEVAALLDEPRPIEVQGWNHTARPVHTLVLVPRWREGFLLGLEEVGLSLRQLELGVLDTRDGLHRVSWAVEPGAVRLITRGEPASPRGEAGDLLLPLITPTLHTERIEIDLPLDLLRPASTHPGTPLLGQWKESRPHRFHRVVEPSADSAHTGQHSDAAAPTPRDNDPSPTCGCDAGGGGSWWWLSAILYLKRRTP